MEDMKDILLGCLRLGHHKVKATPSLSNLVGGDALVQNTHDGKCVLDDKVVDALCSCCCCGPGFLKKEGTCRDSHIRRAEVEDFRADVELDNVVVARGPTVAMRVERRYGVTVLAS